MECAAQPAEKADVLVQLARPHPQIAQRPQAVTGHRRVGQRPDELIDLRETPLFQLTQEVVAVGQVPRATGAADLQFLQAPPQRTRPAPQLRSTL